MVNYNITHSNKKPFPVHTELVCKKKKKTPTRKQSKNSSRDNLKNKERTAFYRGWGGDALLYYDENPYVQFMRTVQHWLVAIHNCPLIYHSYRFH